MGSDMSDSPKCRRSMGLHRSHFRSEFKKEDQRQLCTINSPIPPLHATVGKLRGSALNRYLDSEPKFSTKLPRNFTAAHDADDLPADLLLDHRPPLG
jgi:hypothetical protein